MKASSGNRHGHARHFQIEPDRRRVQRAGSVICCVGQRKFDGTGDKIRLSPVVFPENLLGYGNTERQKCLLKQKARAGESCRILFPAAGKSARLALNGKLWQKRAPPLILQKRAQIEQPELRQLRLHGTPPGKPDLFFYSIARKRKACKGSVCFQVRKA